MHRFFTVVSAVMIFLGLPAASAMAQEPTSIWSGVFTEAQAARGEGAYLGACAGCHLADLSGRNGPLLKGDQFIEHWREASLDILFSTVKSMPPTSARNPRPRLPEATSVDILAHMLRVNGAPAGMRELTIDDLPSIVFHKKTGPEPVPNLTLVRMVGCVSSPAPRSWALTSASEPVRAMNPDVLSEAEVDAAKSIAPGTDTYRLSQIDYVSKSVAEYTGRMAVIKGTLIRQETGARISLTAFEPLADTCN